MPPDTLAENGGGMLFCGYLFRKKARSMAERIIVVVSDIRSDAFDSLQRVLSEAMNAEAKIFNYRATIWSTIWNMAQAGRLAGELHWLSERNPNATFDLVAYGRQGLFVADAINSTPRLRNRVGIIVLCGTPVSDAQIGVLFQAARLSGYALAIVEPKRRRNRLGNFFRGVGSVVSLYPPRTVRLPHPNYC